MPLAWTGTGITGSERAMGQRLGVGPGDHAGLVTRVLGVLARHPDAVAAVRAILLARQEAAADRLDYETAAAIRDELEALAWVVEPQRATVAEPIDVEIAGWSGGILVTLAMHDGRLDEWTVRPMGARTAADRVARTPPPWADLAARAAILAARLGGVAGGLV
jgi:excinuclease ABC subunit C